MHFEKHFTLAEANSLLPWVRNLFFKVHRIIRSLEEGASSAPAPPKVNGNGNGHGRLNGNGAAVAKQAPAQAGGAGEDWRQLGREERIQLVNGLLQTLIDKGIVLQDVSRGLIDFPAMVGAEEVLLCYELEDGAEIVAWHDLHSGFAGRRAIDELPLF